MGGAFGGKESQAAALARGCAGGDQNSARGEVPDAS